MNNEMKRKPNRAPQEVLRRGTMEVVNQDLKNLMFWARYGLGHARGGSAVDATINAIESYGAYLGYSEVVGKNKPVLGKYLK